MVVLSATLSAMSSVEQNGPQKTDDVDTRSMLSLQELDPSPVQDEFPNLENGMHLLNVRDPQPMSFDRSPNNLPASNLGLRGYNWDSWSMHRPLSVVFLRTSLDSLSKIGSPTLSVCAPEMVDLPADALPSVAFH